LRLLLLDPSRPYTSAHALEIAENRRLTNRGCATRPALLLQPAPGRSFVAQRSMCNAAASQDLLNKGNGRTTGLTGEPCVTLLAPDFCPHNSPLVTASKSSRPSRCCYSGCYSEMPGGGRPGKEYPIRSPMP